MSPDVFDDAIVFYRDSSRRWVHEEEPGGETTAINLRTTYRLKGQQMQQQKQKLGVVWLAAQSIDRFPSFFIDFHIF